MSGSDDLYGFCIFWKVREVGRGSFAYPVLLLSFELNSATCLLLKTETTSSWKKTHECEQSSATGGKKWASRRALSENVNNSLEFQCSLQYPLLLQMCSHSSSERGLGSLTFSLLNSTVNLHHLGRSWAAGIWWNTRDMLLIQTTSKILLNYIKGWHKNLVCGKVQAFWHRTLPSMYEIVDCRVPTLRYIFLLVLELALEYVEDMK